MSSKFLKTGGTPGNIMLACNMPCLRIYFCGPVSFMTWELFQPVPLDPAVPFGDRKFYNIGIGYKYKGFTVDACYTYMDGNNSTWNNAIGDPPRGGALFGLNRVTGKFEGISTNLFLLTLSYKF